MTRFRNALLCATAALPFSLPAFGCSGGGSGDDTGSGGVSGTQGGSPAAGMSGTPSGGTGGSGGSAQSGAASGGAAGTAGSASGASGATWGIDQRPANQTCKAPIEKSQAAPLLSQTGCTDPANVKDPAPGLIPYDVVSALWSDGAAKRRYFALPDAGTIRVKDCQREPATCLSGDPAYTYEDEGDWTFPDGTVFVKTFAFGDRLIETRLLVRVDRDNWWGYSYEWRADQSDADLLATNEDGYERMIPTPSGMQTWHFPSRAQCLQCHTDAAGRSLGPETSQLNFEFTYPNGVRGNQLDTLKHIGAFAAEPATRPAYANPSDTAVSVTERARAYLHANCAICHRPGGESSVNIDLRYAATFTQTGLCNGEPLKGDAGVVGALLLTPGDPSRSTLSLRMKSLDTMIRMPRIGTRVVDMPGVEVVDRWITSVTACP